MRTTDTEHAIPIAIPRLMPGSADSASSSFSALVDSDCVDCSVCDRIGSVTIVQRMFDSMICNNSRAGTNAKSLKEYDMHLLFKAASHSKDLP